MLGVWLGGDEYQGKGDGIREVGKAEPEHIVCMDHLQIALAICWGKGWDYRVLIGAGDG